MKLSVVVIFIITLLLLTAANVAYLTDNSNAVEKRLFPQQMNTHVSLPVPPDTLRILTWNVAHGRGTAFNQIFVREKTFLSNLDAISKVLRKSQADIVALQELDSASLWSGGFDHSDKIAHDAGYDWKAHAEHASSWLFNFGTAVLSRLPIISTSAHRFAPSPPTLRKGFVVSQVVWPHADHPSDTSTIDVVSVHLDFLQDETRASQITELAERMAESKNPMIILGDFNSEWDAPESSVQALSERLNLTVYKPDSTLLETHNSQRIDWILLSPEMEFVNYSVLPDVVSDHQAVLAEIRFKPRASSSI